MSVVKVKIPEDRAAEFLDDFEKKSVLTYEGLLLSDQSVADMEKSLRGFGYDKEELLVYYTDGATLNSYYGLTGDNQYNNNLTIVFVPDFYNPIAKFVTGARWFDDIVANNRRRELLKNDK